MTELNERQLISSLKDKDSVDSVYLLQDKQMALGKNGRPFLVLALADATGVIDCRLWDKVEDIYQELAVGDLVLVKGVVQTFQSRKQVIIHKIQKNELMHLSIEDFIPQSKVNVEGLWTELVLIVKNVQNLHLQQLLLNTIEDREIKPLLLKAPAAKTIHHAWVGGLLEHIVSICKIMDFMAQHYDFLNKDFLIFGAIFHDLGKIWELSYDKNFSYTRKGQLLGHMSLACDVIEKKSSQILGFPDELKDLCKHIVLSHHGRLEYGSPKLPMFLEAVLVAMIDDLDSKMSTIKTFLDQERTTAQGWSKYNEMFERYFLLDDLKEKFK